MSAPHAQQGYTLVLLLVSLLGGSVLWTQGNLHSRQHLPYLAGTPSEPLIQAEQARQHLLSYAATYALFYGPRGAGVGHLPCPDTDVSLPVGQGANDGPNPPCAQPRHSAAHPSVGASASPERIVRGKVAGYLPRQISLPGYRFAFGEQHTQRFHYAVADTLINNPVNRVVNPGTLSGQAQDASAVLAEVLYHSPGSDQAGELSTAPLTAQSLLQAIRPAVASWVIRRLNDTGSIGCLAQTALTKRHSAQAALTSGVAVSGQDEPNSPSSAARSAKLSWCAEHQSWLQSCHASSDAGAPQATRNPQNAGGLQSLNVPFLALPEVQRQLVLLLSDALPLDTSCHIASLRDVFVEHVPATDHWFFRNAWHRWVELDTATPCQAAEPGHCRLVLDNQRLPDYSLAPVRLRWLRS